MEDGNRKPPPLLIPKRIKMAKIGTWNVLWKQQNMK